MRFTYDARGLTTSIIDATKDASMAFAYGPNSDLIRKTSSSKKGSIDTLLVGGDFEVSIQVDANGKEAVSCRHLIGPTVVITASGVEQCFGKQTVCATRHSKVF